MLSKGRLGSPGVQGTSFRIFFLFLHLFSMLMSHHPSPPDIVQWGNVPLVLTSPLACTKQGTALQTPCGP